MSLGKFVRRIEHRSMVTAHGVKERKGVSQGGRYQRAHRAPVSITQSADESDDGRELLSVEQSAVHRSRPETNVW